MALKVAVIGASGIGKNHARWFHGHGCDVVAFAGSSSESVARTRTILQQGFGFSGRGYCDVGEMLQREKPDAVCVSSPPELHYEQVMQCLDTSAHVLCEKPLVGDESRTVDELIAQAHRLVQHAGERGLLLETQTQYGQIAHRVLEMCGVEPKGQPAMRRWTMEMETKNIKHGRDYERIWVDMSPHPISILLALGAQLDLETVRCLVREQETEAEFMVRFPAPCTVGGTEQAKPAKQVKRAGGCQVRMVVRVNPERATPLRRITIDDRWVEYSAGKNAAGEFRNYLTSDDGTTVEMDDLVDLLIGGFVARLREPEPGRRWPATSGAQNVEWQLRILQAAKVKK